MKYYKLINKKGWGEGFVLNKIYKEDFHVHPELSCNIGDYVKGFNKQDWQEVPEYQYYAQLPEQANYRVGDTVIVIEDSAYYKAGDIHTVTRGVCNGDQIGLGPNNLNITNKRLRLYNQDSTESKQINTSKEMKEFSISGSVGLKKAFAEELGFTLHSTGTLNGWNFLKSDGKKQFQGTEYKNDVHFNLPEDWNKAKDYVIAYQESLTPKVPTFQMCGYTSEIKKGEVVFGCKHISKDELNTVLKAAEICRKLEYAATITSSGFHVGQEMLSVANLEKIDNLI